MHSYCWPFRRASFLSKAGASAICGPSPSNLRESGCLTVGSCIRGASMGQSQVPAAQSLLLVQILFSPTFSAGLLRPNLGAREFSWSGSQIYFRFKGTTVQAVIDPSVTSGGSGDRFGVLVDGQLHSTFQAKQPLATRLLPWCSRKEITFTLVSGLGDTAHTLVLWKLTEAGPPNNRFGDSAGNIVFKGLLVPSDTQLIEPPALLKRHLRFNGDRWLLTPCL